MMSSSARSLSLAHGNDLTLSTGFERNLGPPQHRYFGEGYRKTTYDLSELRRVPSGEIVIHGIARVVYAPDWSIKAGIARTPHLSSIDTIVIAAWLAQGYLSAIGLSSVAIAGAWIPELFIRPGSRPISDLDRIPARVSAVGSVPAGRPGLVRTTLSIELARLSATTTVEHDLGPSQIRRAQAGRLAVEPMPDVFGELFRHTGHQVSAMKVDPNSMHCRVNLTPQNSKPTGLASAYWPSATLIDSAVIAGQLAQIALTFGSNRSRDVSPNMWIRRLRLQASEPWLPTAESASLQVIQRKAIRRESVAYSTLEAEMMVAGVRVTASLAETAF